MSGIINLIGGLGAAAQFFSSNQRQIGPYFPTVTIQESAVDEMEITRHPVQYGAVISDFAYKNPAELSMRVAWSNSGLANIQSAFSGGGNFSTNVLSALQGTVNQQYSELLQLQVSATLSTIVTGKRIYQNCLIKRISQVTEAETENALFVDLDIEQIIVATIQTTTIAPQASQASPQSTAPVIPVGQQTLQPPATNQSILYSATKGFAP
ncbi:MAG: hypothetical protein PHU06_06125 [Gallionella sp.]|nr:hypothetical protein [Gallionella sp.]MDD4958383.1 hypothetical protein [Gallionella sp.]